MSDENSKELKTEVFNCNACGRDTVHEIVAEHELNDCLYDPEDEFLNDVKHYLIIRCSGCQNGSFIKREISTDLNTSEKEVTDWEFPRSSIYDGITDDVFDRSDFSFMQEDWLPKLPKTIRNLYYEIEMAFMKDATVLAGIGLRTLLEAICIHVNATGQNLKAKIEDLKALGHVSESELPILDKLRLIGNVSAHRIKSIPIQQLNYALQIVNHLLEKIFILPRIKDKIKVE